MNELRWILLGIGLVLLALIYLFSRRNPEDDEAQSTADRRLEPPLTDDSADLREEPVEVPDAVEANDELVAKPSGRFAAAEEQQKDSPAKATPVAQTDRTTQDPSEHAEDVVPESPPESASTPVLPEKVIALHLMPKSGEVFGGIEFVGAVQAEGLKFGRFDIFHRFADTEAASENAPALFSLANMIKPGTFNLHDLDSQQFKGASMFLVLPGPEDAVAAFADMLATGRRLAVTLNGQLLDSQGTQLSRQSASHLREDIINYQHGISATPAE